MTDLLLTFDLDWAPDAAIDFVADTLRAHGVKGTFFVTHASPAVDRLRAHPDLFELGVHPNFLPGSTHGSTPEAVLAHCMALVPGARAVRTHGLHQSTGLCDAFLRQTPWRIDASILLSHVPVPAPVPHRLPEATLWRLPIYFEDCYEMRSADPVWQLEPLMDGGPGFRVLSFHPIHVILNSREMAPYEALKRRAGRLQDADAAEILSFATEGPGARTVFEQAVRSLSGGASHTLSGRLADLLA